MSKNNVLGKSADAAAFERDFLLGKVRVFSACSSRACLRVRVGWLWWV